MLEGSDDERADERTDEGAALLTPLAVALLAGFLPSTELIAVAFVVAVVAMGYRWPGHPLRTAVLLVAPAVVVLAVRVVFVGLDDLGLAGLGVLGWVAVAMSLGFAVVALTCSPPSGQWYPPDERYAAPRGHNPGTAPGWWPP